MIGQYLPQTNKSATVAKFKKNSHLNKAQIQKGIGIEPWPDVAGVGWRARGGCEHGRIYVGRTGCGLTHKYIKKKQ